MLLFKSFYDSSIKKLQVEICALTKYTLNVTLAGLQCHWMASGIVQKRDNLTIFSFHSAIEELKNCLHDLGIHQRFLI